VTMESMPFLRITGAHYPSVHARLTSQQHNPFVLMNDIIRMNTMAADQAVHGFGDGHGVE